MAIVPITSVVLAEDIGYILQNDGGSVDINNPETYFTKEAKINMFSKRKPINRSELFCQDYDVNKPNYLENWWKGVDGNCGLIPKIISSYTQLPSVIDGELNGWIHDLPLGTENSPYRLEDFCDYDTDAKALIQGFSIPSTVDNNSNSALQATFIITPPEDNGTSLTFNNFPTLKNYYIGLYVTNGSTYYRVTSDNTVGDGAFSVSIKTTGWVTGTNWKAYMFLSSIKISQESQDGGGVFYTIPYSDSKTFSVVSSYATIYMYATRIGTNQLNVYIYITYPSSITFTNNTLYIKRTNSSNNPGIEQPSYETYMTLPDFSVQGNTRTLVYNQTITINNSILYNDCKLVLSLDRGQYVGHGAVISLPTPMQ